MSSSYAGIAEVPIDNGTIGVANVSGQFSPDETRYSYELVVEYEHQPESIGNVHRPPIKQKVEVALTTEQLRDLASQLSEYVTWEPIAEENRAWEEMSDLRTVLK